MRKAFDTVSHDAIRHVMSKKNVSQEMVDFLSDLYRTAAMRLEVDNPFSEELYPRRGVKQGDPLSLLLFNLIMNEVLDAVPDHVIQLAGM